MKKKKGAPVKSRATPGRSGQKRAPVKKKRSAHAVKSTPRLGRAGDAARRALYPAIEPFRHGYLRVSDVHEI
jgi:hypothetical protein